MVTSRQARIDPRRHFPAASVDPTEARNDTGHVDVQQTCATMGEVVIHQKRTPVLGQAIHRPGILHLASRHEEAERPLRPLPALVLVDGMQGASACGGTPSSGLSRTAAVPWIRQRWALQEGTAGDVVRNTAGLPSRRNVEILATV